MTYALKLLFFVLAIGVPAAWLLRSSFKELLTDGDYRRACYTLLAATLVAFLAFTPAIFAVAVGVVAFVASSRIADGPKGAVATFALLLVALPPVSVAVGGLGSINQILDLTHMRVLSLTVLLLPAVKLLLRTKQPGERETPMLFLDLAILAYPLLKVLLAAPHSSYTATARSLVEVLMDVWLPYYVITRGLRSVADLRFALTHLVLGCVFVAVVAVTEALAHRHLYQGLQYVYDVRWQLTAVLTRDGFLRVQATMPQPIILAFVMMFAMGVWAWLRGTDWRRRPVLLVYVLLFWALVATWSRGTWLGTALLGLALYGLYRMPPRVFGILLMTFVLIGVGVKVAGADDLVMGALRSVFGGSANDTSSIDYRRQLLDIATALIRQSPWWGVPDYRSYMESLRQGEGIIDLVNTYLGVALDAGLVGVGLFLLPFVWVLTRLLMATRQLPGRAGAAPWSFEPVFTALISATLLVIFTTSSWGVMPYLLVILQAVPIAWMNLSPQDRVASEDASSAASRDSRFAGERSGISRTRGLI